MPKTTVDGISLYYEIYGSGEPLLLIMGLGGSLLAWHSQIPALSRHFQVIAFDNRGCARSSQPENYSISLFAADAFGLLRFLGVSSAHVYGASMGGMIAQQLALDYPEMVRSLVLGVTDACFLAWPPTQAVQESSARAAQAATPQDAFEESVWMGYSDDFVAAHKEELWLQFQSELPMAAPPDAWQKQLLAVMTFDVRDRLAEINKPTFVFAGADDQVVPLDGPKYLAQHIQGAKLLVIPGGRHGVNIEAEDECNNAVIGFLSRLNAS